MGLEYLEFQFDPAVQKHLQNQMAQPVPRHPPNQLNQENQLLQAVQLVLFRLAIQLVQNLQCPRWLQCCRLNHVVLKRQLLPLDPYFQCFQMPHFGPANHWLLYFLVIQLAHLHQ